MACNGGVGYAEVDATEEHKKDRNALNPYIVIISDACIAGAETTRGRGGKSVVYGIKPTHSCNFQSRNVGNGHTNIDTH